MLPPQNDLEVTFQPSDMDQMEVATAESTTEWLWDGYIGRGMVTLLTSQWKAGKTTLLTGLLKQFATGGTFLDRPVMPAKALVVSEESRATWADKDEYDATAGRLVQQFVDNFAQFEAHVDESVRQAAPQAA